ncbi:uncharacterized protein LOC127715955 [Mytilus californianus]|uniref:uncharacterized protein LOC127715955 n=1 Tax=Mytilus californianus TaxID=6549 RepID=UPI002246C8D1|nr:uncharacterized protein LOC127715955 [Mytilus californianus]
MQSEATIQQITALLDEQMPDFAELLNEPRTPSPMKRLRNEMTTPILSPSLLVPSDILFSKYLEPVSPEPFKDPMTYSPSDRQFISQPETPIPSDCTHTNPPSSPEPPTPTDTHLDLTKTITPVYAVSTNDEPIDLSKRTSIPLLTPSSIPLPSPEPPPIPSPLPSPVPPPVPSPVPSPLSLQSPPPLSTPLPEAPLDLTVNVEQAIEPAEIDCTRPANK